jgi:hypothetical protein
MNECKVAKTVRSVVEEMKQKRGGLSFSGLVGYRRKVAVLGNPKHQTLVRATFPTLS